MTINQKVEIADTGKRNTTGSVVYTQVNSGTFFELPGFSLTGEFTVTTTNNVGFKNDPNDSTKLTFNSNETVALQAPRLTLRGIVPASSTSLITNIISLGRTKGIKQLKGGLGFINALPEVSSNAIHVIVKNITFSEILRDDKSNIAFTIQLEQVK